MTNERLSAIAEKLKALATEIEAFSACSERTASNETTVTITMLQKLTSEKIREGKLVAVQTILQAHNAVNASEVKSTDFVAVYAEVRGPPKIRGSPGMAEILTILDLEN